MICPMMGIGYLCEYGNCALYNNKKEECSIKIGMEGLSTLTQIIDQCTFSTHNEDRRAFNVSR